MSALTAQFDADVAGIESEVPCLFAYKGVTYAGSRTPVLDKQAMEDAGFEQSYDFQLIVRVSLFVAPVLPPRVYETLKILDAIHGAWVEYNVQSAQPSQDGVTIAYGVVQKT